jgi:ubiquinone/menaquinone biosynthesis C-methylase UbiE
MKRFIGSLLILSGVLALVYWRWRAKWSHSPCPAWLISLLENPYMNSIAGSECLLDRAGVVPGMQVLDAGCGPGRLTIPAAARVGSSGEVVGLDIQPAMLRILGTRLTAQGIQNVRLVQGGLGEGCLENDRFDRAFLVTVLGEIPNRQLAVNEIYAALKPGGILSVTEVLPDPHFQRQRSVSQLAQKAGFQVERVYGNPLAFTMNLVKPAA